MLGSRSIAFQLPKHFFPGESMILHDARIREDRRAKGEKKETSKFVVKKMRVSYAPCMEYLPTFGIDLWLSC